MEGILEILILIAVLSLPLLLEIILRNIERKNNTPEKTIRIRSGIELFVLGILFVPILAFFYIGLVFAGGAGLSSSALFILFPLVSLLLSFILTPLICLVENLKFPNPLREARKYSLYKTLLFCFIISCFLTFPFLSLDL